MTFREIFNELEGLGTEQNRKTYLRHGSGQNTYGVSFANLKKMAKGLGRDQELAFALWDSENVDAQALATMIADPAHLEFKTVNAWIKGINYSLLVGLLAGLVSKTRFAGSALKKWTASKKGQVKEGGYSLLCHMLKDGIELEQNEVLSYLVKIEMEIHGAPNRVRAAMNKALIAIGTYCPPLTNKAISAAARIGKVEVEHGETSCKTPDALSTIEKAVARRGKKRKL